MDRLLRRGKFPNPPVPSAVADDWRTRGYSCSLFFDPPGQEWLDFVHTCNELVTVVEGRLDLSVDDASFVLEPGDEVFIPKGALHCVRNIHTGASKWLYGYD